jgi:hypothetical protein
VNILTNLIARIFGSPKTSAGGLALGTALSVAASQVLEQAGCHFGGVDWWSIMGIIWGGPVVAGGLATDNGQAVTPTAIASVIKPS